MRSAVGIRLDCEFTLMGNRTAAVVYEPNRWGVAVLRLNRRLLTGKPWDRVLLWARRELASGKRVSWLLADDLDSLP